jgi:hypothetical protein
LTFCPFREWFKSIFLEALAVTIWMFVKLEIVSCLGVFLVGGGGAGLVGLVSDDGFTDLALRSLPGASRLETASNMHCL